jgi:hypothetical protein
MTVFIPFSTQRSFLGDPGTPGGEANLSKRILESAIEQTFAERGVPSFQYSQQGTNGHLFHNQVLLKNVPFMTFTGKPSRSEFLYVHHRTGTRVRIECKYQSVGGSIDEKLFGLFHIARDYMPEPEIWIVLGGQGFRSHIVSWLRYEARRVEHKRIKVFDRDQADMAIKELVRRQAAALDEVKTALEMQDLFAPKVL